MRSQFIAAAVIVTPFGLLLACCSPVNAGLVNHWKFDETTGAVATDSGSGGNDGTIGGSVLLGATGKIGDAFDFQALGNNNANSVVATGYKGILGGNARTVSAWIKADTLSSQDGIVGWGTNGASDRWEITRDGDRPRTNVNSGNWIGQNGSINNTTDFFHVVFSLPDDGSTTIQEGQMYLGGAVLPSQSINPQPVTTGSGNDVRLGRGHTCCAGTFDGLIDDIAIWNEDLSTGEVKGLFDVADDLTLNYDAGEFDILKQLHDGTLIGPQDIDGVVWNDANGLTGPLGLSESGGLFTLVLDAQNDTGVTGSSLAVVPEPSTFALSALCLLSLGFVGWRRRRR